MTPEAERILGVFKARNLRAGGKIHPAEFGDAIVWKDGYVRDEAVRKALAYLFEEGYLIEYSAAFELTERGAEHLNKTQSKHGARVYKVGNTILVKQTVLRGKPPEYVVDGQKERHVEEDNDADIAAAVRDAINGRL
jgi:nucleotide-binding universal stress UspA family protein